MHITAFQAVSAGTLLAALIAPNPILPSEATATSPMVVVSTTTAVTTIPAKCPRSWRVKRNNAPVYELPRGDQKPLKLKHKGAVVSDWCLRYRNREEKNRLYIAVMTKSAKDGVGWMRRGDLTKPFF